MTADGNGLTKAALRAAIKRVADKMEASGEELNALDGRLGDGDLGVTMVRGCRQLAAVAPDLPDDVGMGLLVCAQAFTKISGSSYGTLLATGLMAAAKACKGRTEVPWGEISGLLGGALDAMKARGKANLGDKTVLDAIDAARAGTAGLDDPVAILDAADRAVAAALDRLRDQPAKVGRARIFGEKSIGLDDPGMLAFKRLIEGLKG